MKLKGILDVVYSSNKLKKISEKKLKGKTVLISGISASFRALAISSIYRKSNENIFIFTDSDSDAKKLYDDLLFYEENVIYYPSKDIVFYNIDALSGDLRWERLKSFKRILDDDKKIVVTSIDSLIAYYPPIDYFYKNTFNLNLDSKVDLKKLTKKLMFSGYKRTDIVENIGEFTLRGGLIDIYPPLSEHPLRIELFDNEIDSIRTFDSISQRSISKINEAEIFPAKEIILTEDDFKKAEIHIKEDLDEITRNKNKRKKFSKESFERLKIKINEDLDFIKERIIFDDIDTYFPYFFDNPSSFFEVIGKSRVVISSSNNSFGKLDSIYTLYKEDFENALLRGNILPLSAERILDKDLVLDKITEKKPILMDNFYYDEKRLEIDEIIEIDQKNLHSYQDKIDILVKDIKDRHEMGYKVLILSGSKVKGERLKDMLLEYDINSIYKENLRDLSYSDIVITSGEQNSGFELPNEKFVLFSDRDFFGKKKKRKTKKTIKEKGFSRVKSFTELKHGDYVVHINHGIGIFTGIKQIEREDVIKDYIEITYDKKDKLFIPVEQLDMIQRYIGSEGKSPKINKLGGEEWSRSKAKVQRSIDEIAKDLVKLYALRKKTKGYEFRKDTKWQSEFEDEFMYEDTKGQTQSTNEIKKDMESTKVMDRLLCGDVGYGKTEVAMRASFKAVMDNKQVAVMVPTTILAEQHYSTFKRRFEGYPINIEMISRFKTRKEQNMTIKRLSEGNVDIIIGTHRLVSKDIKFKDLGLLIIDEEQRFGVAHKEKLKEVKKSVDAISLSATPIPRTLHMSLSGIRDISLIDTPPENRYPIQTYVLEYNDQLIRDAILKEKSRKGQVYFVHNRTKDIRVLERYLMDLVPEVIFDVVHGQMKEKELENAMKNFMDGYTDVLITTTIIETGMDIKNVNTLIVNNADKLGLSQLYQLRGRVGRTDRIAYAYLTYQKNKVLTEVAEKRLSALKDFTELGSGFKIAMKDLEIRGAGNLMGKSQHGQMSIVGYDLYIKMLDEAVKKITGDIKEEEFETKIDIRLSAYIPSYYIKNEMQKIEIYKQIASIKTEEDYTDIEEELMDRFSDIPDPVYNLMDIARLKYYANKAGISEISDREKDVKIIFDSTKKLTNDNINTLVKDYRDKIEFLNKETGFLLKYNIISKIKLIEELQNLAIKII